MWYNRIQWKCYSFLLAYKFAIMKSDETQEPNNKIYTVSAASDSEESSSPTVVTIV